jgi:nucleotide-binding universal stress UspA family protein
VKMSRLARRSHPLLCGATRALDRYPTWDPVQLGHAGHAECRHVVVGYSGSPASGRALYGAAGFTGDLPRARLLVAYVTTLSHLVLLASGMPCVIGPLLRHEDELAACREAEVAAQLGAVSVEWRFAHLHGDIADQLRQLADASDAAAIVVGKPRMLLNRVTGSVPARLLHSARQPTVVL